MFKNILLPIYNNRRAERAIPYALEFAERAGAHLTFITIVDKNTSTDEENKAIDYIKNVSEETYKLADGKVNVCWELGRGELEKTIARYVEKKAIDLVCLASSTQKGLITTITGNHTERITRAVHCPALVVSNDEIKEYGYIFSHILMPLDGSEDSTNAQVIGAKLAKTFKLSITLFTMVQPVSIAGGADLVGLSGVTNNMINKENFKEARQHLEEVAASMTEQGIDATFKTVMGTNSADEIAKAFKEYKADLTVMVTRDYSPMEAFFMASTSRKIVSMDCLPVLMIRQK